MTSRFWEPMGELWGDMQRIRREMDQWFNRAGVGGTQSGTALAYPPVNLWQDGERLYVEAELPGFDLNGLEIYVSGGDQLTIRGERKAPEVEGGTWHRQERGFGQFARVLTLPCQVEAGEVEAELKNGVLTVKLPKCQESRPRRIAVKAE
jgi:HSP20 family protein